MKTGLQLDQKETLTQVFLIEHFAAASGFLTKLTENDCEKNHFSVELFSEISWELFLSLSCSVSRNNSFPGFSEFLSLNMLEEYLEPSQTSRWSLLQK